MVKVISLSEEAYGRLKNRKTGEKSFSDIVIELTQPKKKRSIMEFFGVLKEDDDFVKSFKKAIDDRKNIKLRDLKF